MYKCIFLYKFPQKYVLRANESGNHGNQASDTEEPMSDLENVIQLLEALFQIKYILDEGEKEEPEEQEQGKCSYFYILHLFCRFITDK